MNYQKNLFYKYLFVFVLVFFVVYLVLGLGILSIANALVGEEKGHKLNIVIQSVLSAIIGYYVILTRGKTNEEKREYLHAHEGKEYSFLEDKNEILTSHFFWKEFLCISIIHTVELSYALFRQSFLCLAVYPLIIVIFIPFNFIKWSSHHRYWMNNRIRK